MRFEPLLCALGALLAPLAILAQPAHAQASGDADCRAAVADLADPGSPVNLRTGCLQLPLVIGDLPFLLDEHGAPAAGIAGNRTRLEGFSDSIELEDGRAILRSARGEQTFVSQPATGRWEPGVAYGFAPDGTELVCGPAGCQMLQAGVATHVFEDARGGRFYLSRLQDWGGPNATPHLTSSVTVERPSGQVHPTRISDNRGSTVVLHYNAGGTLQRVIDRFGRETRLTYSADGSRLTTITHPGPDGATLDRVLTYGPHGQLQYVVGPDGTGTRFDRHPGGRVSAVVDVVASAAGGAAPTVNEERQRGGSTFGYGGSLPGFSATISEVRSSFGQVERIGFEAIAGRPRVTVTEGASGSLTTYTYDAGAAGRLTAIRRQDGTGLAYAYDGYRVSRIDTLEPGNQARCFSTVSAWHNGWVPRQYAKCGDAAINVTYDGINRPVTVNDGTNTWSYVRTGDANQSVLTVSLNGVAQGDVTFDGRGDTIEVAQPGASGRRVVKTVTRDPANGLVLAETFLNGITRTYTGRDSNPFKLPTQVSETGRAPLRATFDNWGNVTSQSDGTDSLTQSYDALGRPTEATLTNPRRPVAQTRRVTWIEDRAVGASVNGEQCVQIQPMDPVLPPVFTPVPEGSLNAAARATGN